MEPLLAGKNAIISGAGGGIGRGVARTFAREVVDLVESLDVSFNLTSRGDVQGIPLIEMSAADFVQPIRRA